MRKLAILAVLWSFLLCPMVTFAQEDVLYGVTMLGELYSIDPDSTDTYIGQKERVQLLGKYLPIHSLAYVNGYFYATFGTNANRMVRFGFSGGDEVELEAFQDLGFENVFSLERKDSDSVYIGFAVSPSDNRESDEVGVLDLDTMSTTVSTPLDTPHSDCIQGIAYDDSLVTLDWGCGLGAGNVFDGSSDTYLLDNTSLTTGTYGPVDGGDYSLYEMGPSRNLAANSSSELYMVSLANPELYLLTRNGSSPYLSYTNIGSVMDYSSCSGSLAYGSGEWACEFGGLSYGPTQPSLSCDQLDTALITDVNETSTAYYTREGLIAAGKDIIPTYYGATGIVQIEDSADVTYTSGTKIVLADGFYAWEGSEFLARIDSNYCS